MKVASNAWTSRKAGVINRALARPLHTASKGNLRALKKLLMYACMYAADRKDAVVIREDFIQAFEDANGSAPDRLNPFAPPVGNGKKS